MHDFTPLPALLGGLLIGLSASLLLLTHGRIAGISGVLGALLDRSSRVGGYQGWFLLGLLGAGLAMRWLSPSVFGSSSASTGVLIVAGLLVGYGSRLGNGCTSGHGVCGLSRLSVRSLVATVTFMATGFLTVWVTRHVLAGGAP